MTNITNVFEFWDLIETCGFQENMDDIINYDDNYKDNNNNYDISTLGHDREPDFTKTWRTIMVMKTITTSTGTASASSLNIEELTSKSSLFWN